MPIPARANAAVPARELRLTELLYDHVLKSLRDLPALSPILVELVQSFEDPDVNIGLIAAQVSRDPALSAKTLRLANSSFYGLGSKVRTIQQAIAVLGFDSVRSMVASAAIINSFDSSEHTTFNFTKFWQHSIATALCAKSLANFSNLNSELAFMCGLLHDIGTLLLVTKFPEQHAEATTYRNTADCDQIDAEQHVLMTDHAAIGSALAAYWKFPVVIQRAIAGHHAPTSEDVGDMACLIHAANVIVHALDICEQEDDAVSPVNEVAWDSLSLDSSRLCHVFRATEEGFEDACRILSI